MRLGLLIFLSMAVSACGPAFQADAIVNNSGVNDSQGGGGLPPDPVMESFDIFSQVATPVGQKVDQYYKSHNELLTPRGATSAHSSDFCEPQLKDKNIFAERISFAVLQNMTARKAKLAFVSSLFGLPAKQDDFVANSLMSHVMCEVTAQTLTTTIGAQRVPSASVIAQANDFAKRHNEIRARIISGQDGAALEMAQFWSRTLMCLSYVESLTSADTSSSDAVAQKYAPSDYRRPAGVLFYEDPAQSASSRLNLGLFQFTPDAGGDFNPCLKQWNEIYPTCQVSTSSTPAELIRVQGSSYQTLNAFCAANKPAEMFSVQINTNNVNHTHPANRKPDGSLKPAQDRCVSLHFLPGNSYNSFGPFQNSTGNNLEELLTCALAN